MALQKIFRLKTALQKHHRKKVFINLTILLKSTKPTWDFELFSWELRKREGGEKKKKRQRTVISLAFQASYM